MVLQGLCTLNEKCMANLSSRKYSTRPNELHSLFSSLLRSSSWFVLQPRAQIFCDLWKIGHWNESCQVRSIGNEAVVAGEQCHVLLDVSSIWQEKGLASWPGGHFIISVFTGSQPAAAVEQHTFYLLPLYFPWNFYLCIFFYIYVYFPAFILCFFLRDLLYFVLLFLSWEEQSRARARKMWWSMQSCM